MNAEEWWKILENYNVSIFPAQIFLHIIAIIVTVIFFIKPEKEANIILKVYLTASFAWIGIIFFLILGTGLEANSLSAFLFILVAVFFGIDIFRNRIEFMIPEMRREKILMVIFLLMAFLYPLIGYLIGHTYPRMIFLGTFPCSTTAFALTFLAFSVPKIDLKPYILLLIWAIPFPIFIQIPKFGVYEDSIMLAAGILAVVFLIRYRKQLSKENII